MGERPTYLDVDCCLIHYAEHLGGLKRGCKEFADRILNRSRYIVGKNNRIAELDETQTPNINLPTKQTLNTRKKKKIFYIN